MIEANVLGAAYKIAVPKVLFLGSSCVYPRLAAQPIGKDALLTGPVKPTKACGEGTLYVSGSIANQNDR